MSISSMFSRGTGFTLCLTFGRLRLIKHHYNRQYECPSLSLHLVLLNPVHKSIQEQLKRKWVKLVTVVEGDPKAPFSIAITLRCREGATPFPGRPVGWGCRIHRLLLCWEVRPSTDEYPRYDTKQSDSKVPVILELWGMRSTPSLPSLPGPLWPRSDCTW